MDFTLPPEFDALRAKARDFVAREVIPLESDPTIWDDHENIRLDRLEALRAKAKAIGIWAPQAPREDGGMGLSDTFHDGPAPVATFFIAIECSGHGPFTVRVFISSAGLFVGGAGIC